MRGSQVEGTRHVNSRIVNGILFSLKRSDSEVHVSLSLSVRCRAVAVHWIMGVCFVVLAQQVLAVVVAIGVLTTVWMCPHVGHAPPPPREWPRSALLPSTMTARKTASAIATDWVSIIRWRKPVGGLLPGGTTALGLSSFPCRSHRESLFPGRSLLPQPPSACQARKSFDASNKTAAKIRPSTGRHEWPKGPA
ncbi:hypothetical protein M728_003755 (plasmid) [Ensifer sp. WSM1721]